MLLSKKLLNLLFGNTGTISVKINLRNDLNTPLLTGETRTIYWEGNKGLIITMWEKIEKLEEKNRKLEIKIKTKICKNQKERKSPNL